MTGSQDPARAPVAHRGPAMLPPAAPPTVPTAAPAEPVPVRPGPRETAPPDLVVDDQPSPFAQGTLARRLVVRVTALLTLAAVLLTCATALATRTQLVGQLDDQLQSVIGRFQYAGGPGGGPGGGGPGGGPGGGLTLSGQPIGTLYSAYLDSGDFFRSGMLGERGSRTQLSDDAAEALSTIPVDEKKHSVTIPGLGRYRVAAYSATIQQSDGTQVAGKLVVGVPLSMVDGTIINLVGLEAVLSLIAIVGTIFAARAVVARSLRPLIRVAATAQHVSRLALDRGEVALAVRVPPEDTNPNSEVGRVGQAINHMLNNVEDALTARQASETKVRQFVADASHELRNPLAAIRGYAELTRRGREQLPSDAAYAMSRVESEAERMSRLVEDLLLLARLDSGPDIDVQPVDLTEIVINAVSDARAAGPEHTWTLALPDEPISALGDRHRLHQVVVNLLANARTHTPAGTHVETGIAVRDGRALLTVTDDGPGIPSEIQGQVFERFTRADTSRVRASGAPKGASTGLGLAIVAAVVEAHQGRVGVASRAGRTEFTVELPLAPAARP